MTRWISCKLAKSGRYSDINSFLNILSKFPPTMWAINISRFYTPKLYFETITVKPGIKFLLLFIRVFKPTVKKHFS